MRYHYVQRKISLSSCGVIKCSVQQIPTPNRRLLKKEGMKAHPGGQAKTHGNTAPPLHKPKRSHQHQHHPCAYHHHPLLLNLAHPTQQQLLQLVVPVALSQHPSTTGHVKHFAQQHAQKHAAAAAAAAAVMVCPLSGAAVMVCPLSGAAAAAAAVAAVMVCPLSGAAVAAVMVCPLSGAAAAAAVMACPLSAAAADSAARWGAALHIG